MCIKHSYDQTTQYGIGHHFDLSILAQSDMRTSQSHVTHMLSTFSTNLLYSQLLEWSDAKYLLVSITGMVFLEGAGSMGKGEGSEYHK